MQLLIPTWDTWFWRQSQSESLIYITDSWLRDFSRSASYAIFKYHSRLLKQRRPRESKWFVIKMNATQMTKQNKAQQYHEHISWDVLWFNNEIMPWRCHQMETLSALLAICAGNSSVTGEFPTQRPVTRSFDFFICAWINGWVNNGEAGDLRCHRAHYDVIVMQRNHYIGIT